MNSRHFVLLFLLFANVEGKTPVKQPAVTGSFVLRFEKQLQKCLKAVPPIKTEVQVCSSTTGSGVYRWQWTKDGQVQNTGTGLCIDVAGLTKDEPLQLATCNYRKSFQKWRCQYNITNSLQKLFYVYAPHEKEYVRWTILADQNTFLTSSTKFPEYNKLSVLKNSADLCDFNHRDVCLQVVGKVPNTGDTCMVAMATKNKEGYMEVPISFASALNQFTISVWIKLVPETVAGVFSYKVNSFELMAFTSQPKNKYSTFSFSRRNIKLPASRLSFILGFWTHLALTWSSKTGRFVYYVNGKQVFTLAKVKERPVSPTGTLFLGRVKRPRDAWFNGFMTQFNIFSKMMNRNEIGEISGKLHCCTSLLPGDRLSWKEVLGQGKLVGHARKNDGAECTSFEDLPKDWPSKEQARWTCSNPLFVADPRYIPDHHFSSTTCAGKRWPWYARASEAYTSPYWCPHLTDRRSFVQVYLGFSRNVTAFGSAMRGSHGKYYSKRVKVHYSEDGVHWKSDGKIYGISSTTYPLIKISRLVSPVMAQYLRFYPMSCTPGKCCLSLEVYGCDPELDKRLFESEVGCAHEDKPYILMDLGEMQHVRRIQIGAQSQNLRKLVRSFYFYYMSWNQWVPYQVEGKTKVFKGTTETTRSFTHILAIPILARLIKIYPLPYAKPACGEFVFIGCPPSREDFCDAESLNEDKACAKVEIPQCKLGFIGNGNVCQDLNECEIKHGKYCDRNSICKNQHGYYECSPCKNQFIGDGKICQTSCEALGIVCRETFYCDVDECLCRERFIDNGTTCVYQEPEQRKQAKDHSSDVVENTDGLCSGGVFNCYGDVIGALDKLRKAVLAYKDFDHLECSADG